MICLGYFRRQTNMNQNIDNIQICVHKTHIKYCKLTRAYISMFVYNYVYMPVYDCLRRETLTGEKLPLFFYYG